MATSRLSGSWLYSLLYAYLNFTPYRNFRLADLVTIMNGFCGSFSIFSSGRYLVTQDESYLWQALAFPLAGLMFDFFDGKVARWRRSSSMLGQELDSLADLVSMMLVGLFLYHLFCYTIDIIWCSPSLVGIRCWASYTAGYGGSHRVYLLWSCSTSTV